MHTLQVYYLSDEEKGGEKRQFLRVYCLFIVALILSVQTLTNLTGICSSSL